MAGLWKIIKNENGEEILQRVKLTDFDITGPTLVYLSGALTTDKREDHIFSGLKTIERLVRDHPDTPKDLQVYAWSHDKLTSAFNGMVYNLLPSLAVFSDGRRLAKHVILSNTTNTEKLQEKLKYLTIAGYSSGSTLVQQGYNGARRLLRRNKYKKRYVQKLLQEVALLSFGNVSRHRREKNRFTTVYLAGRNDLPIQMQKWVVRPLKAVLSFLSKKWGKQKPDLALHKISPTSLTVTTHLSTRDYEWVTDNNGDKVKKDIEPLLPHKINIRIRNFQLRIRNRIRSFHEVPHYITLDPTLNEFSHIAQSFLVNATRRTEKQIPEDLILPPPSEDNPAYEEKMKRALIGR